MQPAWYRRPMAVVFAAAMVLGLIRAAATPAAERLCREALAQLPTDREAGRQPLAAGFEGFELSLLPPRLSLERLSVVEPMTGGLAEERTSAQRVDVRWRWSPAVSLVPRAEFQVAPASPPGGTEGREALDATVAALCSALPGCDRPSRVNVEGVVEHPPVASHQPDGRAAW